jgi:hypothetical protein
VIAKDGRARRAAMDKYHCAIAVGEDGREVAEAASKACSGKQRWR